MNANDLSVCVAIKNLKWFTFHQNNCGGRFIVDDKVDAYVIIQAHNADEANYLAQGIGIYFDGVDSGDDCDCCGDRWSPIREEAGTDVPEIYGDPVAWSPEAVLTSEKPNDQEKWLERSVKVYPYSVITKM